MDWKITGFTAVLCFYCFGPGYGDVPIRREDGTQCYKCVSSEWQMDAGCEAPDTNTPWSEQCGTCYTVLSKSPGAQIVVRECMTEQQFSESQFNNQNNYNVSTCNSNLCNNVPIDMTQLDQLQGVQDQPDQVTVDNVNKSCYRCSSLNSDVCVTVDQSATPTSSDCTNRLCVTVYDSENTASMRDCYTWSRLKHYLQTKPNTSTYEWCNANLCNDKDMQDYQGCAETTTGPSVSGCSPAGEQNTTTTSGPSNATTTDTPDVSNATTTDTPDVSNATTTDTPDVSNATTTDTPDVSNATTTDTPDVSNTTTTSNATTTPGASNITTTSTPD
ncbi:hypothetical protein L9F63_021378, partial [Diploptera punctata]